MHAEFPDYYGFASKSALDLAATQRLLGPDEAILLVVPTPFGTQVMAISRTQVEWRRSDWDRARIATAVKRLLFDMGQDFGVDAATAARWVKEGGPGTPFDRRTAYSLYRQLVAPVDSVLAGKRHVFIATSGALTSLPFGILATETPKGSDADPAALRATRWLADVHALSVIPSIQDLRFLREAATAPVQSSQSMSFAGYGDPTLSGRAQDRGPKSGRAIPARAAFQAGPPQSGGGASQVALLKLLASLPGTADELKNMRAAVGAPASSVHLQDQATERAVRTDDLSHIRILAFATHGLMAVELTAESEPGLVFTPPAKTSDADDGFLKASEVTELKLDADWVILSACNTAAGDGSEGTSGLSGLARAFFYAGARSLLVSHWPVRDDVAARQRKILLPPILTTISSRCHRLVGRGRDRLRLWASCSSTSLKQSVNRWRLQDIGLSGGSILARRPYPETFYRLPVSTQWRHLAVSLTPPASPIPGARSMLGMNIPYRRPDVSPADIDDDYRKAGFGGRLPFGERPALLVVDVVRAYLDSASPFYAGVEDALASMSRLVSAARASKTPVIYTKVVYQAGGADGGVFMRKVPALACYEAGNPMGDIASEVTPQPGDLVFAKQYASAFFGTSLAATLTSLRIDTVIMGGFSTSGCVRASALDALQHGFIPYVVREACGDRDARPHEASLFDLQAKYAEVVGEAEALALLAAHAA